MALASFPLLTNSPGAAKPAWQPTGHLPSTLVHTWQTGPGSQPGETRVIPAHIGSLPLLAVKFPLQASHQARSTGGALDHRLSQDIRPAMCRRSHRECAGTSFYPTPFQSSSGGHWGEGRVHWGRKEGTGGRVSRFLGQGGGTSKK